LRSICALTILISSTGGPTSASQIPEPASALRAQRITSAGKQAVRWAIWRFGIWTQSTQLSCPDYWRFITALARSTVFRQLGLLAKLKSTSEKSCGSDACSSQGTVLRSRVSLRKLDFPSPPALGQTTSSIRFWFRRLRHRCSFDAAPRKINFSNSSLFAHIVVFKHCKYTIWWFKLSYVLLVSSTFYEQICFSD
jgi:hypothetical protein